MWSSLQPPGLYPPGPLSVRLSRREHWSELPLPSPGTFPTWDQTCISCAGRWVPSQLSHQGSLLSLIEQSNCFLLLLSPVLLGIFSSDINLVIFLFPLIFSFFLSFFFFFWYAGFLIKLFSEVSIIAFFSFIFISCRLITLQYCSGFCHTLTWISHGFTCIPHPDPPSHLPLYPIPRVFPVHQARAVVLCIQPGLVICFTIDNIHVSMLFSQNKKYGTLHEFACHPCAGVMLIFSVSFQF